jgi:hypothetical protein
MTIILFALGVLAMMFEQHRLGWTLLVSAAVVLVIRLAIAAFIISSLVQHASATT